MTCKHAFFQLMVVVMVSVAPTVDAFAKEKPKTAETAPPPPAAAVQAVNPQVNGITQAAVQAGVLSCTSRINQVANFLAAGTQQSAVNALMFMPANNPDQHLISFSMEIPAKENASAYTSASFAPNQANGCGGMYEAIVYWPQSCKDLSEQTYGNLKKINGFSKNMTVLDGGMATRIFLLPAGAGCVSIKKEVIQ